MTTGDAYLDTTSPRIPTSLEAAVAAVRAQRIPPRRVRRLFVDTFVAMLRHEVDVFARQVTDWERDPLRRGRLMDVCRVVGQAVSTAKDEGLHGTKLMLVRSTDPDGAANGPAFAATDTVGAGEGELVLVAAARRPARPGGPGEIPTDAAIVAILDSLSIDGKVTYHKE